MGSSSPDPEPLPKKNEKAVKADNFDLRRKCRQCKRRKKGRHSSSDKNTCCTTSRWGGQANIKQKITNTGAVVDMGDIKLTLHGGPSKAGGRRQQPTGPVQMLC